MVVVKLMGGLGNQMFQYAAGRALAHAFNTSLKLDISFLSDNTPRHNVIQRPYELSVFNIKEQFPNKKEVQKFTTGRVALSDRLTFRTYTLYKEPHFHFAPDFLKLKPSVYLDGFWQSEEYFKAIKETIVEEFSFKEKPEGGNKQISDQISGTNSVSIHVRRGDYISNPYTNSYHGTCDLKYYQLAIEIIAQRVTDPYFFVFSDDIEWTKEHLVIDYPSQYVDQNNGDKSYEDLRLMSTCKHNIIANSSFSWWGAWLNSYPDKIVVAPEKWFNNSENNTKDLLPPSWIKVNTICQRLAF